MERMETENRQDRRAMRNLRKRNMALSILLCVLCALVLILPAQDKRHKAYSFDSAIEINLEDARSAYAQSGENAALYCLTLALCRAQYLSPETFDPAELRQCGLELYRRAKAGILDLEEIGNTDDTIAMLELLKEYGVTPVEGTKE